MNMTMLFIYLAVIGVLAWLATYVVAYFSPSEFMGRIVRVAIVIITAIAAVLVVVNAFGMSILARIL